MIMLNPSCGLHASHLFCLFSIAELNILKQDNKTHITLVFGNDQQVKETLT